jgi:hypothetical protein
MQAHTKIKLGVVHSQLEHVTHRAVTQLQPVQCYSVLYAAPVAATMTATESKIIALDF